MGDEGGGDEGVAVPSPLHSRSLDGAPQLPWDSELSGVLSIALSPQLDWALPGAEKKPFPAGTPALLRGVSVYCPIAPPWAWALQSSRPPEQASARA